MTALTASLGATDVASAKLTLRPEVTADLLVRFPARPVADCWEVSSLARAEVLDRLLTPPFTVGSASVVAQRRRGLARILEWLSQFPGDSWQARWLASGAAADGRMGWRPSAAQWLIDTGRASATTAGVESSLTLGLGQMINADVLRPSLEWLLSCPASFPLSREISRLRDPAGFAALARCAAASGLAVTGQAAVLELVAFLVVAKGGLVTDITVGDCVELIETRRREALTTSGHKRGVSFYQVLHTMGIFPGGVPGTLRMLDPRFQGQLSNAELIDQYTLACRPIRDLLVAYLDERRPAVDYSTLTGVAYRLGKLFWKDLETHSPGIDSLRLSPDVATAWQLRIRTTQRPVSGEGPAVRSARLAAAGPQRTVRAFYLDIGQWALDDPARWGPWAVPCPIRLDEREAVKEAEQRRSRSGQRTRERLPVLPTLTAAVVRALATATALLDAAQAAQPDALFTVGTVTLRRSAQTGQTAVWVRDPTTGRRRDLTGEHESAFFSWAAVEVLRETGIRIEELCELSHHSLVQYRVPTSGELVPLLHIAPSKSDIERIVVISPELADVLAAVVHRVRRADGAIPLVIAYDTNERVFLPPMPVLFQRQIGADRRPIAASTIRAWLNEALASTGLTDGSGQPLRFTPVDFRRIFATDAIMNGMPPHICQLIMGHRDINTTMGYKAVYPEEAINGHRAFIARRRELRPAAEYRSPTEDEWEEFLGHFQRRKVSLGDCGRAYGTSCIHEHSCVRCSLLRVDPAQRDRLVEVRDNLIVRIVEAEKQGWLGDVEGYKVSLAAANNKLAQLELAAARRAGTADLGTPTFRDTAAGTATPYSEGNPS